MTEVLFDKVVVIVVHQHIVFSVIIGVKNGDCKVVSGLFLVRFDNGSDEQ